MAMDLQTLHTDGANFYQYLRGNPFMGSDPLGLSSDPFDMVDDFITTSASERAAFLSNVGNGMKSAAIMAATIASFLPIPGANIAGELALYALGEQDWQTTAMNLGTGFIPGAAMLSKLAKIRHGAVDIAMKSGGGLRGGRGDGIQRAVQQRVDRKRAVPGACGCFTAATLVFTQHGMVPISQIELGDVVIAQNDAGELVLGEVTDLIETQGAALVLVTVQHESGELEIIETTDEHPFFVECPVDASAGNVDAKPGFVRADLLEPGDRLRKLTGTALVARVQFSAQRETVYNFTVGQHHTYHVGASGVLVHNCPDLQGKAGLAYEAAMKQAYGLAPAPRLPGLGKDAYDGLLANSVLVQVKKYTSYETLPKGSSIAKFQSQIGEQAAIARKNGYNFALMMPAPPQGQMASWLSSMGITVIVGAP